jgi:hypothetical protein
LEELSADLQHAVDQRKNYESNVRLPCPVTESSLIEIDTGDDDGQ